MVRSETKTECAKFLWLIAQGLWLGAENDFSLLMSPP
jgi:hypothetical protein